MKKRQRLIFDRCGDLTIRTTIYDDGSATVTESVGGQVVQSTHIEEYSAFRRVQLERAKQLRMEHAQQAQERKEQQERENERAQEEFRRVVYGVVSAPITTERAQANILDNADRPRWDGERCELYYRGQLARKVRRMADRMRKLLQAFEEDDWPARIDNPLSPADDLSRQLRDLNDLINGPLRFRRDGGGEGILWEVTTDGEG